MSNASASPAATPLSTTPGHSIQDTEKYNDFFVAVDTTICVTGHFANSVALIILILAIRDTKRRQERRKNFLLMNLVVTDLLDSSIGIPSYIVSKTIGFRKVLPPEDGVNYFCLTFVGVYLTCHAAEVLTLVFMSIDRFLLIKYTQDYVSKAHYAPYKRVIFIWTAAACMGYSPMVYHSVSDGPMTLLPRCVFTDIIGIEYIFVYVCLFLYAPFFLMIGLNLSFYRLLQRKRQRRRALMQRNMLGAAAVDTAGCEDDVIKQMARGHDEEDEKQRQSAVFVTVLVMVITVTWVPLAVVRTAQFISFKGRQDFYLNAPAWLTNSNVVLWHVNDVFDPVYYIITNDMFKSFWRSRVARYLPKCLSR